MARPIRLGKAAGELNVGMSTIVDFLESNGASIDASPNTKLTPEQYDMLRTEFAADQDLKEQSKRATPAREKRETISIRDKKEDAEEAPEQEPAPEPTPEPVAETPAPTPEPEPTPEPAPKPDPEPVAEKPAEPEPEVKDDGKPGVKTVGKIDLESINQKTRPDKKSKEPEAKKEPAKEQPAKEEKPAAKEAPKKEVAAPAAKKVDAPEEKPAPKETETIRAESKKLTGPNVVGKIELPVEKPRGGGSNERRKRKRVRKVDVNKQTQQQQNKNKGKKRVDKPEITEQDIQREIKETLARLSNKGGKSKGSKNRRAKRDSVAQRRQEEELQAELEEKVLKLTEFVSVSELATMMNVSSTDVISACMSLGIFASINQRLDAETIQIVAEEFGYETEFVAAEVQESIPTVEDKEEDLIDRAPIVTVMGHVDHGKTSLLDRIRNANVTEGEAGGITQHIGAYSVKLKDGRNMTFLDTPGHEAFTAMRARGAQVTDVAIIIVAADDDVMPQTKEAISHAQAAGVPMIFAINKIDKPGANPDKIKEQLSAMNILVEDWGGKYQCQEISAKKNGRRLAIGDFKELNLIVKGDVDGSIEALSDSMLKLSTEEIQVNIIHKGVGAISEADVNLASASEAIILGFQVRPSMQARKLAEVEQIDIRLYSVIYKAIDEIKAAMEGMLSPDVVEEIIGSAEVREVFNITKVGTIAGCYVTEGIIKRSSRIRVIRDGIVIHTGKLGSLKRFKDDVKEVKNNYECGLNGFNR